MNRSRWYPWSAQSRHLWLVLLVLLVVSMTSCGRGESTPTSPEGEAPGATIQVTSPAFQAGETIPTRFTCEGENISPELSWSSAPAETESYVLIVDDPDAPSRTFTHWVLFDIPATVQTLAEGVSDVGTDGQASFGETGYGGPCPPPGHGPHRYFFKLYALDTTLSGVEAGASRSDVESAMQGHVLAEGQIMGRYERE